MKSKFKYGIFDLDGTIVNSIPTFTETFCEILKEKYAIPDAGVVDYYLSTTGIPLGEQFGYILMANGKPTNKILEMTKEFLDIVNRKNFVFFDGAKKALSDLHKKGIMLFLSTGSEDEITQTRLGRAGILEYFASVLGSSKKEKGPWHIEKFAKAAKVPIDEFSKHAFYVGDGPYDMRIAKMFEIYAIGIPTTVSKNMLLESGANEVIGTISEITGLKSIK